MKKIVNFCPTHHLYYSTGYCPLCEEERIAKMIEKLTRPHLAEVEAIAKTMNYIS